MIICPQGTVIRFVSNTPEIDPAAVSSMTWVYMGPHVYLDIFMLTGELHRIEHCPPWDDAYAIYRQIREAQ